MANCEFMPNNAMAPRRVHRRDVGRAAAAEVQAQRHRRPARRRAAVPVVGVVGGQAEPVRGLDEGDRSAPFAAVRSTSATDASTSQNGTITIGMKRLGRGGAPLVEDEVVPRETHAAASSFRRHRDSVEPAKPGNDGKHSWACTPSRSMSASRARVVATGSISSKRTGSRPKSFGSFPATALSPMVGIILPSNIHAWRPPSSSTILGPASWRWRADGRATPVRARSRGRRRR